MSEGKPFIKSGQLFDWVNAYDYCPQSECLFTEAMNESLHWHIMNSSIYKSFLSDSGLVSIKNKYLTEDIPPILADIFKENRILSVPEKQIKYEIISGNKKDKRLILDAKSHKRLLKIYENIFKSLELTDYKKKVNYICLTTDPKIDSNQNNNFYFNLFTSLTAHRSVYYAFKINNRTNDLNFNIEDCAKKIIDFSCHSEPVRIIGSAFFLSHVLNWLEEHQIFLKLDKESYCFILDNGEDTNLLKSFETKVKEYSEKYLGIQKENFRKIFILPEHGIPLVSCKKGELHIPIYYKAFVLEPEQLYPLLDGESGILNLATPYLTSYPAISLITNFKAVLNENCSCGLAGKTVRILDYYDSHRNDSFL